MDYSFDRVLFPHDKFWNLDEGLFVNSTSKFASFYNKEATSFIDSIDKNNCLVVLGENRIGKTEFLKLSFDNVAKPKLWFEFKNLTTPSDIDLILFNKDFDKLYKKNDSVYIFLDGLDEALSKFGNIYYKLLSSLKRYDNSKIKLILSCRTYYFPQSFEQDLKAYFGLDNKADILFDLTPLSIDDIEKYLLNKDIYNFEKFNNQIALYKLKPLLAFPFLLPDIISLYNKEVFIASHNEMYLQGIKTMLCEVNTFRQEQVRVSPTFNQSIKLEEKIIAAGLIALMLIKQEKTQVFIGDTLQTPDNAINIEEINKKIINLKLSSSRIDEIFSTALFNTANGNAYSFRHNNLKNFLSAYYLYNQSMSIEDKLNEVGNNNKIIPMFQETASWLAQMDDNFFNLIYSDNASFLIKSVPVFTDKQNELLIKEAINLLSDSKVGIYGINRQKLVHKNLLKQVKSLIDNSPSDQLIIEFCMDLIYQGRLDNLQNYLFKWADQYENLEIKEDAIEYLSAVGTKYYKNKLCAKYESYKQKLEDNGFDKQDRLRGAYLTLLSSNGFSISKILDLITPMKVTNYYGTYQRFLTNFPTKLNKNNIYIALKWAIEKEKLFHNDSYSIDSIATDIIKISFKFVEDKKVFNLISKYLYGYFNNHHYSIRKYKKVLEQNEVLSKNIFLRILNKYISLTELKDISYYQAYALFDNFMADSELMWLCEQYEKQAEPTLSMKLKEVISKIIKYHLPEKLTEKTISLLSLYETFNQDIFLVEAFGKLNTRIYKYKPQKWEIAQEKRESQQKAFDPVKNIKSALADVETNLNNSVVFIIQNLTVRENTSNMGDLSLRVENYSTWIKLSKNLQDEVLRIFYKYLKIFKVPNINDYIQNDTYQYSWFVLAFVIEMIKRNIVTKNEIKPIIQSWAPFVLKIPNFDNSNAVYQKFIEFYFSFIPDELIKSLINMIKYNPKAEYPRVLEGFENICSVELNRAVYNLLKKDSNIFSSKYLSYLLEYLFKKNFTNTLKLADELLEKYKNDELFFIEIATILMCFGTDSTLKKILDEIKNDTSNNIGRNLLSNFIREASYKTKRALLSQASESTIADYYTWLYKAFTYEEEQKRWNEKLGICSSVTNVDNLSEFRRLLLNIIKNGGYTKALEIIGNNFSELKNETWFNRFSFEVSSIKIQMDFLNKNESSNVDNIKLDNPINSSSSDRDIIVYVEAENDALFHSIVYNNIKIEYPDKLNVGPNLKFEPVGNKEGVISRVEEERKNNNNIFGIVDRDYQNVASTYIKVPKDRYALENYIVEPLFQLYVLSLQLSNSHIKLYQQIIKDYPEFTFDKISKNKNSVELNYLIKAFLKALTDKVKEEQYRDILREDYKLFTDYGKRQRKVEYLSGITLDFPMWILEIKGKKVLSIFKQINPNGDVNNLIKNFYKTFKLIPADILLCYNDILCCYSMPVRIV